MRDVQYISAIAAAVLAIGLLAAAGFYWNMTFVVKLAILSAAMMYLVQAGDAVRTQFEGSMAAAYCDWIVGIAWLLAIVFYVIGLVVVLFA